MSEIDFTFIASLRKPEKLKKIRNLTGQKHGRLLALGLMGMTNDAKRRAIWMFKCDCGNVIIAKGDDVSGGNTTSCGCCKMEQIIKSSTTHGMRKTRTYKIWCNMKARCNNPNHIQYDDYGGRGITYTEHWGVFQNFLNDMGEVPDRRHSIERLDNNGNYTPDNCVWATADKQAANKRNNRNLTIGTTTHHVAEWARITGIGRLTIHGRLEHGWTPEEALGFKERIPQVDRRADGTFNKNHRLSPLRKNR